MKSLVVVAAALLLAAALVVAQQCPNNCSGHGNCGSGGVCGCSTGWAGTDCSISDTTVSLNVVTPSSVLTRQWRYFTLQPAVAAGSTLRFEVNQTSASGDVDVYVAANRYPTRTDYDLRDIGTAPQIALNLPQSAAGVYHIGVYGWSGAAFALAVRGGSATSLCPGGCSGHGQCQPSGQCLCAAQWAGVDCSQSVVPLTPGAAPVAGSAAQQQWAYFAVAVPASPPGQTLTLTVVETGPQPQTDCDLYARQGAAPTLMQFDARNFATTPTSTLAIAAAAPGQWYVGVYGFGQCQFTVAAALAAQCPTQCSGHGSCAAGSTQCVCQPGFSGAQCQTMTAPLPLTGTAVTGVAAASSWNYYRFLANSAANVVLSVQQLPPAGDCDLYVRHAANPTFGSFDYRDISTASSFNLTVSEPGDATWYVGVYAFGSQPCNYSLAATSTTACPEACSGHGQCLPPGLCQCDSGYTGDGCQYSASALPLGPQSAPLADGVAQGEWNYYVIPNTTASFVEVQLQELQSSGQLWLYIAAGFEPTLLAYSEEDTSSASLHRVSIQNPTGQSTAYQVGVYGGPFARGSVSYQVIGFTSSF